MIKYQVLILESDSIKSVKQHVGYAYVFLVDHLTTRPSYQQVFLLLPLSKNLVKIFEMIHVMLTRYAIKLQLELIPIAQQEPLIFQSAHFLITDRVFSTEY